MSDEPKATMAETEESVIVERDGKRYEVYFDHCDYAVFVGQPGEGTMIVIDDPRSSDCQIKIWPRW